MLRLVPKPFALREAIPNPRPLDIETLYSDHAQFLWKSLYQMGIPESDLADVVQEVLLVVHRKLESYDGTCKVTTWLFGICLRVAATARRTRRRRRENVLEPEAQAQLLSDTRSPEQELLARDARRRLAQALDALDPEKRAVLVMFELEGQSCGEIAEILGVPKGTIFSRLSHARQSFLIALKRLDQKAPGEGLALGGKR